MCRCGASGHGLGVELAALGLRLDSMIVRVFSKLNDSMILQLFLGKTRSGRISGEQS